MIHFAFMLAIFLAVPCLAGESATPKAIPEVDALRLENMHLTLRALQAEATARLIEIHRLQEAAGRYVEALRQREQMPKCEVDLPKRQWVCPEIAAPGRIP